MPTPSRLAAAACLAALPLVGCGGEGPAPGPAEPAAENLLLVVLDTLRPDRLGTYGYERDTSPHLDAFAAEALVFENAQSAAPWTAPALHSLVTGLYPTVHGVKSYPNPGRMSDRVVTLAEVLRERGYRTAAFTEGGFARAQFGLDQGFEVFPENPAFQLFLEGKVLDGERLAKQVDAALAWMREAADEPFFLFFHTYRPHIPWDAPEEGIRRFRPGFDEAADHAAFREVFAGSPIKRIGRARFIRNVLIAIGNSGDATLAAPAEALLGDAEPLVRGAAVWALSRLLDRDALSALRQEDEAPDVNTEWRAALD